MSGQSEEKTEEGSQRKHEKEREKGNVLQARDAIAALITVALLGTVLVSFALLALAPVRMFEDSFEELGNIRQHRLFSLFLELVRDASIVFLSLSAFAVLLNALFNMMVRGYLVFSSDPLQPKFDRLNPVSKVVQLFQKRNLIEFSVNFVKLAAWLLILAYFVHSSLPDIAAMLHKDLVGTAKTLILLSIKLAVIAMAFLLVFLLVDLKLQQFLFKEDMKMTKTDVKREQKDDSGSPEITQARKALMQELLEGPSPLDQTTFIAKSKNGYVGIHYEHGVTLQPSVTMSGTLPRGRRLLIQAKASGVPVIDEPALVQAVSGKVKIGQEISSPDAVEPFARAFVTAFS